MGSEWNSEKWWKVIAVCSKLNRNVQMNVTGRVMSNSDEEFWVMQEAGSRDEVKHVGRSGERLWVMMHSSLTTMYSLIGRF